VAAVSTATRETLLDAIAMLRAANAGDGEARAAILDHANTRELAASLAALAHTFLVGYAQAFGVPAEELPAAISRQLDAALARQLLDDELGPAEGLDDGGEFHVP
jgi:hypothetical protein